MRLAYRIGWFGWRLAARLGVPLALGLEAMHDREANMFVAASEDFLPEATFACEAPSKEALEAEAELLAQDVLESVLRKPCRNRIVLRTNFSFG